VWLRVSHRALDPLRSRPFQPVLLHERVQARRAWIVPVEPYDRGLLVPFAPVVPFRSFVPFVRSPRRGQKPHATIHYRFFCCTFHADICEQKPQLGPTNSAFIT
jgi:hypothetical protein